MAAKKAKMSAAFEPAFNYLATGIGLLDKNRWEEYYELTLSMYTEAVEVALKLMRIVGKKRGKKKPIVISFENNWHGRTMGAQMLSSDEKQKEWIGYLDPNIHHLPFPYPWIEKDSEKFFTENIEKLIKEKNINPDQDICGFMLETFQGWGAIFYPPEFVKAIETFAKKRNILVAFDEMQAGFGRTGKL